MHLLGICSASFLGVAEVDLQVHLVLRGGCRRRSGSRNKMDETCGTDDTDEMSYEHSDGGSDDDSDVVPNDGGESEAVGDMGGYGASGEDGGSAGTGHDDHVDGAACDGSEAACVGDVGQVPDFSPSAMLQLPLSPGTQVHVSPSEGDRQADQDDDSQGLQEILRGRASDLAQTLN